MQIGHHPSVSLWLSVHTAGLGPAKGFSTMDHINSIILKKSMNHHWSQLKRDLRQELVKYLQMAWWNQIHTKLKRLTPIMDTSSMIKTLSL